MMLIGTLLLVSSIPRCWSFINPNVSAKDRSSLTMNFFGGDFFNSDNKRNTPLEKFSFSTSSQQTSTLKPIFINRDIPFDPASPDDLISRAKTIIASDLGILDGGRLLDDNFIWIGAANNGEVLSKAEYLAAGKFFELRTAFPDWDFRAHDFRLDLLDPMTVRLTARTVGNMRGPLRLRNDVLFQPNGKQMICPPEAISITFGQDGKVKKLCSGFVMDRLVGNTAGLCGVMAAAGIAGAPPSALEIYPITTVVARFFARPQRQLMEPKSYLAPFPETVMIQLAKGVTAAQMASLDPDLLSDKFTFSGTNIGPMDKKGFLNTYAAIMFGGAEPELAHFRVDPYDPYRVWVDVRSYGQFEDGDVFETPPQAMSFTFDDDGYCVRLTGDVVMDPSIGNTGGLGGLEGINYAAGSPSVAISTRSLPEILSRIRRRALEPFTQIGVDDFALEGQSLTETTPQAQGRFFLSSSTPSEPPLRAPSQKETKAINEAEAAKKSAEAARLRSDILLAARAEREASRQAREVSDKKARKLQQAAVVAATSSRKLTMPWSPQRNRPLSSTKEKLLVKEKAAASKRKEMASLNVLKKNKVIAKERAAPKKPKEVLSLSVARETVTTRKKEPVNEPTYVRKLMEPVRKTTTEKSDREKREGLNIFSKETPIQGTERKAVAFRSARDLEDSKKKATSQSAKQLISSSKAGSVMASTKQKIGAVSPLSRSASSIKPVPPSKPPPPCAFGQVRQLSLSRTIALPKKKEENAQSTKKSASSPPKGVPALKRWKRNPDGSVIGFISGSDQFDDNERITTSPIVMGDLAAGNIVRTRSGSRYFLT